MVRTRLELHGLGVVAVYGELESRFPGCISLSDGDYFDKYQRELKAARIDIISDYIQRDEKLFVFLNRISFINC